MSRPDASAGASVRALAARLDARVVAEGRSLQSMAGYDAALPERDRPLLRAMLLAALRWHHRLDWAIDRLLDRPLKAREAELAALLRIGLAQIDVLRIPDHAAVSATVAATAELGLSRARGLVNAVLRRYLREREALAAAREQDEVARFSHPRWLIDRIRRDWPDDWPRILDANNALPPLWLRVNRRALSRDAYLERLAAAGLEGSTPAGQGPSRGRGATEPAGPGTETAGPGAEPVGFEDAVLLAEPCPVEALPGFAEGLVSVQDAAAQLAPGLLCLAPGQRVLDACAAPGGKTAHILERCPDLAEVVAVDNDPDRLARVGTNLTRLRLAARLVAGDAASPSSWWDGAPFDRILVDAPCSATGVIRRHPDIKLLRRDDDIAGLQAVQRGLLEALWPLLAPGGRMVYVTCSVLRDENRAVVDGFVSRAPDARVATYGGPGHFQRLPGETNMDGFYYACLDKGG